MTTHTLYITVRADGTGVDLLLVERGQPDGMYLELNAQPLTWSAVVKEINPPRHTRIVVRMPARRVAADCTVRH